MLYIFLLHDPGVTLEIYIVKSCIRSAVTLRTRFSLAHIRTFYTLDDPGILLLQAGPVKKRVRLTLRVQSRKVQQDKPDRKRSKGPLPIRLILRTMRRSVRIEQAMLQGRLGKPADAPVLAACNAALSAAACVLQTEHAHFLLSPDFRGEGIRIRGVLSIRVRLLRMLHGAVAVLIQHIKEKKQSYESSH